ncbi:MAG: type II secretion system GspH family protein [Synergistaceae bacterium]|nr:type II secretion system GspH family protein [Synergistaceae bacterium]
MKSGKRAFTLVEVMIVVGIAGLIMAVGLAPLVYSVRLMSETRAAFTAENRERYAINGIALDVRELVTNGVSSPFRLFHKDALGEPEDYLFLWTITPSYMRLPLGTVVFGIPPESVLGDDYRKGLYRWLLSGDLRPDEINVDDHLKPETGRLILAGVENVGFKALQDGEWVDEYTGGMPQALRISLKYGRDSGKEEKNYDVWLPKN